jgi:hypothetical protein
MERIRQALFQQMRFSILATGLSSEGESPCSTAYLYARSRKVYPALDAGLDWHLPHEDLFDVREAELTDVLKLLELHWGDKKRITFYELERHHDARGAGLWSRDKLVTACRYVFLSRRFDPLFWTTLVERGNCPVEADLITEAADDGIYLG